MGGRIVLIEKNQMMRLFLSTLLGTNYYVESFESVGKAIKSLDPIHIPNLLIHYYDENSQHELEVLKNNLIARRIPKLAITCSDKSNDRIAAFQLEADDCISKPFNPQELRCRITKLIRKNTLESDTKLTFAARS